MGRVAEFIYTMRKVRKAHGDKVILDDVTLSFLPGAKIGVVGPNGAGKSSVLRIMAGLDQPNNGDAFLAPAPRWESCCRSRRSTTRRPSGRTSRRASARSKVKLDRFNEVAELMATDYSDELMEEMGRLQEELDHADAWDLDSQLEMAMDALRCPPPDEPVTHLSGGERRRVALCKLLLSKPDLLLLDEPTNHLDAESVQWLEQHLAEYKGAILAVTHDRYFLDNVAEWILELDRGRAYPTRATTRPTWRRRPNASRSRARRTRSCRSGSGGAGLGPLRCQGPAGQEQGPPAALRGDGDRGREDPQARLRGDPDPGRPRLGNVVVEVEHLDRGLRRPHPDQGPVVHVAAQWHRRRDRGPMVSARRRCSRRSSARRSRTAAPCGSATPSSSATSTRAVPVSTRRRRSGEVVSDKLDYIEVGQNEIPSRAYVSAFGFKGPDQQKPAGVLSGGERNRLNLALTLKQGGNLLLLDEPTNDLDVETLGSLENALEKFPGCAVVISHDRWFLDRTCTHILAWEGDASNEAKWFWFEGNSAPTRRIRSSDSGPRRRVRTE